MNSFVKGSSDEFMKTQSNKALEKTVSSILKLLEILREMDVHDHTGHWLQFLHSNHIVDKRQVRARRLMDRIVQYISEQNGQVSSRLVYDRLLYGLLQEAIWFTQEYSDFLSSAKEEIEILFEYDAHRTIDIPIVYLAVEHQPVKFGAVTFHKITEKDQSNRWWEKVIAAGGNAQNVCSFARVISLGDLEKSKENARMIVNDMLTIIRAIGFPITTKPQHQFGLLNEFPHLSALPYRIDPPVENHKLEASIRLSTTVGPGIFSYNIQKDIFDLITPANLENLQKLIENDYLEPTSELKRKFFLGLRWLGEATKSDTVEARFVKLFFSLEGLIGGEIKDSRETKFILGRRCAIVAGKNSKDQKEIYDSIQKYYRTRSEIVHGANKKISDDEFSDFGDLVRKVAWSLLEKVDYFTNINELHNWVLTQPLKL